MRVELSPELKKVEARVIKVLFFLFITDINNKILPRVTLHK